MHRLINLLLAAASRMPFWMLFLISDAFYILGYYILGYRRKVILTNLRKAFPEKRGAEIRSIESQFFRNLLDYFVETLKILSISKAQLAKRHTYSGVEVFEEIKKEGKGTFLLCGHVFNWEWFVGLVPHLPTQKTFAVYHRIHNPLWDKKVNEARGRFGTTPLEMGETARQVLSEKDPTESTYLFVADQSPFKTNIRYELDFLNQKTPVFIGYDKLIRKRAFGAVYAETVKVKRGYYHTRFKRLEPRGEHFEENELVDAFFECLEETIRKQPNNWLWSHRRWKYSSENL